MNLTNYQTAPPRDVERPIFPRAGLSFSLIPSLITPGAAEALAVKVYRLIKTEKLDPLEALRRSLTGYQSPVAPEIIRAQIQLAVAEASDMDFVPDVFR